MKRCSGNWGSGKNIIHPCPAKISVKFDPKSASRIYRRTVMPWQNALYIQKLTGHDRESLLNFSKNGYAVIREYLSGGEAGAVNDEIENLLKTKKVRFNRKHKIMFAIRSSRLLHDIANKPDLIEILSALLGGRAVLFQSINFLHGSEQATHSDSIHMTTFIRWAASLGVWIALEDISLENGLLHYYPGSHKPGPTI